MTPKTSLQSRLSWSGPLAAALLALALLCCGLYVSREQALSLEGMGFPLDDSWIHLQFARNLAEGNGLSFRQGRLVSGSTAPLWTAILAFAFLLPGSPILWVKLFGVALFVGGAVATYSLCRALDVGRRWSLLAVVLYLLTDSLVWSALSGMEIGLFVVLSIGGVTLHLRERQERNSSSPSLSLFVLALASLARPEGMLLFALAVFDALVIPAPDLRARRRLPSLVIGGACGLALILAFQLFSVLATDSVLPTTFAAKTGGLQGLLPSGRFLYRVVGILFRPQPVPLLLAAAGVLALIGRLGTARDRGLLVALWPFSLPVVYSLFDSPEQAMIVGNFGRYYFPLFPFVLVLSMVALDAAAKSIATSHLSKGLALLLLLVTIGPAARSLWIGSHQYALNVRNVGQSDVAMAKWIVSNVAPEAVVAVQDIGAVGYFTENPLLDLTGIVNPEILPWIKGAEAERLGSPREGLLSFLGERRPSYMMFFSDSYPGIVDRLDGALLHRLAVEDNITMAGRDLLLLETEWR